MKKNGLGQWLKELRKERGWSHAELARRCEVNRITMYKMEEENRIPKAETFASICNALNVSPVILYQKAGLIPEAPRDEELFEQWKFLLSRMDPEDEEELRQLAEIKVNKRRKEKH